MSSYAVSSPGELRASDQPCLRLRQEKNIAHKYMARRAAMLADQHCITPSQKVARLILALSNLASRDGRALDGVSDALDTKFAASLLGMDVGLIKASIDNLTGLELVKSDPSTGTLVVDTAGLERLA